MFTLDFILDEFEDIDVRKNNHTNSRRKRRAAYYDKWKRSHDGMVYIPYQLDISVRKLNNYCYYQFLFLK